MDRMFIVTRIHIQMTMSFMGLPTGVVVWVPGLCGRTVSRVPHIQFTRKLFLRVPDVHIYLVLRGMSLFRLS
jgi:hypothetical protein